MAMNFIPKPADLQICIIVMLYIISHYKKIQPVNYKSIYQSFPFWILSTEWMRVVYFLEFKISCKFQLFQ